MIYRLIAIRVYRLIATCLILIFASQVHSKEADVTLVINAPEPSSVTQEQALAAWDHIYSVASHPRCANCHVDESNVPMWSGPSYGEARPHGMNIHAGTSRIGAEHLLCSTCHVQNAEISTVPNAAPHSGAVWRLAPVEFVWYGKSSNEICEQMKDPARNGGRDANGLVEHVLHDASEHAFAVWGFNPGPGREPAPGTLQELLDQMLIWAAGDLPCPSA